MAVLVVLSFCFLLYFHAVILPFYSYVKITLIQIYGNTYTNASNTHTTTDSSTIVVREGSVLLSCGEENVSKAETSPFTT